ncbi:unnamed protein product [Cyclocybe aegerita]|uniref:Uncharacterized protein n=1 Tax=Cyclocybe aegerita TaxID=1973307 RepID=A0A8S0W4J5_CYCAE|nr:unnamed protein product [Cyclocybe aegerita]
MNIRGLKELLLHAFEHLLAAGSRSPILLWLYQLIRNTEPALTRLLVKCVLRFPRSLLQTTQWIMNFAIHHLSAIPSWNKRRSPPSIEFHRPRDVFPLTSSTIFTCSLPEFRFSGSRDQSLLPLHTQNLPPSEMAAREHIPASVPSRVEEGTYQLDHADRSISGLSGETVIGTSTRSCPSLDACVVDFVGQPGRRSHRHSHPI